MIAPEAAGEGPLRVKSAGSGLVRRPSGLRSVADTLLHCREPPQWAKNRL
jgi:hypothetical protein